MKRAGIATLICAAVTIISIGLSMSNTIEMDPVLEFLLLVVGGIGGGLGFMISLALVFYREYEKEKSAKAALLTQLANNLGVSEFRPTIGTVDSKFCIDTIHGLFAAEFTEDTEPKIMVAPVSHILDCSLEEETRTVNNAKSRAIVGGALAGTVGAVAGAASAKERQEFVGYILKITTDLSDFGTRCYSVSSQFGLTVVHYFKG